MRDFCFLPDADGVPHAVANVSFTLTSNRTAATNRFRAGATLAAAYSRVDRRTSAASLK